MIYGQWGEVTQVYNSKNESEYMEDGIISDPDNLIGKEEAEARPYYFSIYYSKDRKTAFLFSRTYRGGSFITELRNSVRSYLEEIEVDEDVTFSLSPYYTRNIRDKIKNLDPKKIKFSYKNIDEDVLQSFEPFPNDNIIEQDKKLSEYDATSDDGELEIGLSIQSNERGGVLGGRVKNRIITQI